jgi:hypothetical protein
MPKTFTHDDVLAAVRKEVAETSLLATAARIGVSAAFLGDVLRGNRGISEKVAESFGFHREIQTKVLFRKKVQAA